MKAPDPHASVPAAYALLGYVSTEYLHHVLQFAYDTTGPYSVVIGRW